MGHPIGDSGVASRPRISWLRWDSSDWIETSCAAAQAQPFFCSMQVFPRAFCAPTRLATGWQQARVRRLLRGFLGHRLTMR